MRTKLFLAALAILLLLPFEVAAGEEFNYSYFDMTYLDNGMDGTITAISDRDRTDITIGDVGGTGLRMSLALDSRFHAFAGYSGSNMDLNATQTAPMPTLAQMGRAFFTSSGAANFDYLCDLNGDGAINFADLQVLRFADSNSRIATQAAVDGNMTDWRLGIGYHRLLAPQIDAFIQLFWDDRDLSFANAMFRGEMTDFDASENGLGATIGIRGKATDRLELSAHVTYSPVMEVDLLAATGSDMLKSNTMAGIGGEFWFTDAFSMCAELARHGDLRAWLIAARYELGN